MRDLDRNTDVVASSGSNNYYPGGSHCIFNDNMIECLTFCSESGGITAEIQLKILEYFDAKEVFPRIPDGPILFLLVDGHNTYLDPLFINYISNESCWQKVYFGVSCVTSLWQVGDSAENNGTFKTKWYCLKDELLMWKYEVGMEHVMRNSDVISLLTKVFTMAFG